MKYAFILLTIFLTSMFAKAETCSTEESSTQVEEQQLITTDVPSHLKGATIIVRLANGKESKVPAEKFKVVPRKQQYLVTKVSNSTVRSCVNVSPYRHRVSALAGYGATGHLDRNVDGNNTTVEADRGFIGGVMYQYKFTDRWSLGLQGQGNDTSRKNKTGLGVLGYDF